MSDDRRKRATTHSPDIQKAMQLIQSKEYDAARDFLSRSTDPKALALLQRLNAKYPSAAASTRKQPAPSVKKPSARRSWKRWALIIASVFIILIVGFLIYDATVLSGAREEGKTQARLFAYCLDVISSGDRSVCSDWPEQAFATNSEEILACNRLSPELDTPFNECLIQEDILPPGVFRR